MACKWQSAFPTGISAARTLFPSSYTPVWLLVGVHGELKSCLFLKLDALLTKSTIRIVMGHVNCFVTYFAC